MPCTGPPTVQPATAGGYVVAVADAMVELDLPDDALRWALDGIERTSGWQVAKLYDLAANILASRGDAASVLEYDGRSTTGCRARPPTGTCALRQRRMAIGT